ncbi:hypothetical protein PR048_005459, partial [Dryococelus australis]
MSGEVSKVVRQLLSEVEQLVKLLMKIPDSSCEAETSFSTLRRLKTYLRNTMTQKQLNYLIWSHVHKEELDRLNLQSLCTEFISRSD